MSRIVGHGSNHRLDRVVVCAHDDRCLLLLIVGHDLVAVVHGRAQFAQRLEPGDQLLRIPLSAACLSLKRIARIGLRTLALDDDFANYA